MILGKKHFVAREKTTHYQTNSHMIHRRKIVARKKATQTAELKLDPCMPEDENCIGEHCGRVYKGFKV